MKSAETTRLACRDCQAAFDLAFAPASEWPEDATDFFDALDLQPIYCPFCGARQLKPMHDRPLTV